MSIAVFGTTLFVTIHIGAGVNAGSETATVTFNATPGGHISPSGPVSLAIGSTVQVSAWADDSSEQPGLAVDGVAVPLSAASGGHYSYSMAVTGTSEVDATFAELAANVVALDAAATTAISSVAPDGSSVTFDRRTPVTDRLAAGDIIGNGVGSGATTPLLLKVDSVERSGDTTTVRTEPAKLTDAVKKASVRLQAPTSGAATAPATSPGSPSPSSNPAPAFGPIRLGPDPAFAADSSDLLDVSLDETWSASTPSGDNASPGAVQAQGTAELRGQLQVGAPELDVELDINGFSVSYFEATLSESAQASLDFTAAGSATVKKEFEKYDHEFEPVWIPFWILEIPVFPELKGGAGVDAQANGSLEVEGSAALDIRAGVQWSGGAWSAIHDVTWTRQANVSLGATATATVYPYIEGSASVLGLGGPYIEVRPGYLDIEADIAKNPWWEAYVGVSASFGVETVFTDPWQLASADILRDEVANAGGPFGGSAPPTMYAAPTLTPGSFYPTGSMEAARALQKASLLADGRVLITGGGSSGNNNLASAELYDPTTGLFSPTGSMASPRQNFTATLMKDGKVLVVGGLDGGHVLASAELYDPTTGTFSPTGSMLTPRSQQTAALLPDGRVLIAGGQDGNHALTSAELFDPTTGTFNPTGPLTKARYGSAAAELDNGSVLVAGGAPLDGSAFDSAEVYDPTRGTFSPTGPMPVATYEPTATTLDDGTVLIAGGEAAAGAWGTDMLSNAQVYDPATNAFTPVASMGEARWCDSATLLPNGYVLLVGGSSGGVSGIMSSAELYNPTTHTFSQTGDLPIGRIYHTATLLKTGLVLIAGGDNKVGALSSAELYEP